MSEIKFEDILKGNLSKNSVLEINPIVLAFIGDAVHTLFVRDMVVKDVNLMVKNSHKNSASFCNNKAQALKLDEVFDVLTKQEQDVVRRARNAKTNNIAKHSNLETYKKSTSYEALIGYLYLIGNYERLNFILKFKKEV